MVKTCLISNNDPNAFIKDLNACIADKKVIDIKYSTFMLTLESWDSGAPKEQDVVDRALVIYEEG